MELQKKSDEDLLVTKSVHLNKKDAETLKILHDNFGVDDIYFQATPSASKTSLDDVLKKFNL